MPRTIKANATEIFKNAEAYFKVYRLVSQQQENNHYSLPMIEASLTNHAFACELYLKCIYCIENNESTERHEPHLVFEKLKLQTQQAIAEIYYKIQESPESKSQHIGMANTDLISILTEAKTAYQRFRYAYEARSDAFAYRMHDVLKACRRYILQIYPEWPVLNAPL
jgi:hypothetical protein